MIVYANTKFTKTSDGEYVPGANISEEGLALVFTPHQGKNLLDLSTGAAGEVFAGFSISRSVPPKTLPMVDTSVVADGTVQLSRVPDVGNMLIKLDGNAVADTDISVGAGVPAAAGKVVLDGSTLRFHADDEGKSVFAQYHFEPTVREAADMTGDAPIGGDPAAEMGRVGRIIEASPITISTFDASADWAGVVHPKLGANGMLTSSGPGTELKKFVVVSAPSAGNPYLTLEYVG